MKEVKKRRFGDRKDGYRLRKLDDMHIIMPFALPKRTDNEAVLKESLDFENVLNYLKKKNEAIDDFKYTIFHIICAAIAKTIYFRPKLNYFISGYRYYERNEISLAFVIKERFEDAAHEALAKICVCENEEVSVLDQIRRKIKERVDSVRKANEKDETTKKMKFFTVLPRFATKFLIGFINFVDYFGWLPKSYTKDDPYFSTVFISNLGSIKMTADYHHLANYGTNSFFAIVGEMQKRPVFNEDGSFSLKHFVDIGVTVDERIADGLYFAKSIKFLKHLIENPSLLDESLEKEINFENEKIG